MIEIVCPSCEARYQLPDGSIGPDGRNVSCSSCAHKWRAFAEGQAPAAAPVTPAAPAPAPEAATAPPPPMPPMAEPSYRPNPDHVASVATAPQPTPQEAAARADDDVRAIAATLASVKPGDQESGDDDQASAAPAPAPAAGDREEQMEAIRKMLSDLKDGAEVAAAAEVDTAPAKPTETAAAPIRRRREEEDGDSDMLKSRIDELSKTGKAAKGEATDAGFDSMKLRKLHERRAKKLQKARDRRKKSGAFMSGFTFVAVIVLTMVGLYVMKPQIVAASPQMAPAMDEYVVTVDRYRVELNDKTAVWREWAVNRIAKLRGEEEGAEPAQ